MLSPRIFNGPSGPSGTANMHGFVLSKGHSESIDIPGALKEIIKILLSGACEVWIPTVPWN